MARIIADDLWVCSDCLDAIEFTDDELGYADGTLMRQQKKMKRWLSDVTDLGESRLVSTGSEPRDFSASRCDGCGSMLHGARYEYAALD